MPMKKGSESEVSGEISHLMRDKGYPQKRAVAASLAQAREAGSKRQSVVKSGGRKIGVKKKGG